VEERAARRLGLVPDEYDQVLRLGRFREDHPAVVIEAGNGWWQGLIPEPDGEIVTTRYTCVPQVRIGFVTRSGTILQVRVAGAGDGEPGAIVTRFAC
jgi:hypothetical protein